jgi:hypothetical protein
MQPVVDRHPDDYDLHELSHVAPIAFEHINPRGTFRFDLEPFREQLPLGDGRYERMASSQ